MEQPTGQRFPHNRGVFLVDVDIGAATFILSCIPWTLRAGPTRFPQTYLHIYAHTYGQSHTYMHGHTDMNTQIISHLGPMTD